MRRTYLITGAASGIGRRTRELLESQGARVIGIDLRDAEVIADLSDATARSASIQSAAELADGIFDAVIANAGSAIAAAATVSINFFGATDVITAAHPFLLRSRAPRVVATGSMASLMTVDDALVAAMLRGDENAALSIASSLVTKGAGAEQLIYPSTKRALSRWIRRQCITADWAGAGIPLNAVGPGIVRTPMVAEMIATEEGRAALAKSVPMPLHGYLQPENVAALIAWLASEVNTHTTGQTIYIDGGADAVLRGDNIWAG